MRSWLLEAYSRWVFLSRELSLSFTLWKKMFFFRLEAEKGACQATMPALSVLFQTARGLAVAFASTEARTLAVVVR